MSEKTQAIGAFILDEAKKWAARTFIMLTVGLFVLMVTPLKDRIERIWHSPDLLLEVLSKLDELTTEVQRATGEDRVIFEVPGQSYVREPVHVGDQITLNMVVRRTKLGLPAGLSTAPRFSPTRQALRTQV